MTPYLEFRDLVSRPDWGHPAGSFYLRVYVFLKLLEKKGCLNCGAEWRSGKAKDFGPRCRPVRDPLIAVRCGRGQVTFPQLLV